MLPDHRRFMSALVAAFFLHVSALVMWELFYEFAPPPIPVKPLVLKIGSGGRIAPAAQQGAQAGVSHAATMSRMPVSASASRAQAGMQAKAVIQNTAAALEKPVVAVPDDKPDIPDKPQKQKNKSAQISSGEGAGRKAVPETPATPPAGAGSSGNERYIRSLGEGGEGDGGSPLGNSAAADAEAIARYEQVIAAWIEKHKEYPEYAKLRRMEGNAIVRVRISREGRVLYAALEYKTRYPALDQAAMDMIRRSDPVPAVPPEYPAGTMLEFLIPVSFKIVDK